MNISLKVNKGDEVVELKNTVESINLSNSMHDAPGKCEFTLIDSSEYPRGSIIELMVNNEKIFYGYIFTSSIDASGKTSVTAYDQMRYLKNQDTIYYEGMTASQIFEDICKKNNLKCKIVNPSKWIILPYLYEKKTMFDIIKHTLEESFRSEEKKYMIRDNFGVLEFIDIEKQKTNLQIGTGSLLTDYTYTNSIDEETYNVVKLIRDNKETQKRDVWQVMDSNNIKRWGKLQFLSDVDEQANEEQIKELANNILKVKNKETRSLDLSILGFFNVKSGDGIRVKIDNVLDEWFYLAGVTTEINNNMSNMGLEVFIV